MLIKMEGGRFSERARGKTEKREEKEDGEMFGEERRTSV
jgi:hypothetical protein